MKILLEALGLTFKDAEVHVPFSPELTFIHGQVGTGKSSIARLVDWCLGADMDYTPALEDELVAAVLLLRIGDHDVRIARDREDKFHVRLSWKRQDGEPHHELVPLRSAGGDRDPAITETLSDHLFVLAGVTPLRVPRSRKGDDSSLQRLSFRDFLAFCYLPQETLNVSLLRFDSGFSGPKSGDVMRAMLGLYSELQQQLQNRSDTLLRKSTLLTAQAEQVTGFLDRLEVDDEADLERELERAQAERDKALADRAESAERLPAAHPTEEMRAALRELDVQLVTLRQAVTDIDERLDRDKRLRAELITAQLKLDRSAVAVEVLTGVRYAHCPQCGNTVTAAPNPSDCHLCHLPLPDQPSPLPPEATEADLQARIDDLAEAAERHRLARRREIRTLSARQAERQLLDARLAEALRAYESSRLATAREVERRVATAEGDLKRLSAAKRMRSEVRALHEESGRLKGLRAPILEELKAETARLAEQERHRDTIAAAFREALLEVGMPDVTPEDKIVITDKLVPRVEPAGGRAAYGFKNLGSSGMKTLFQCCYALALHRVAAEHDLLLPRFLIIDTPTQHVDERVDSELFHNFFRYLYGLMEGPMRDVQVVLIDSDLVAPPDGVELVDRLMLRDDPASPRLVPYYTSPTGSTTTGAEDDEGADPAE